jgi:hypothetical protein
MGDKGRTDSMESDAEYTWKGNTIGFVYGLDVVFFNLRSRKNRIF